MLTERALCPILVHRQDEMTLLEDALLTAFRGDGQMVVLAGDAGVGKTRLATETADRARKIGATVMWGGCSEAELALPYLPFVEAVGNWLGAQDSAKVSAALGPAANELGQLFPQLGGDRSESIDRSQAKLRLFEAVLSLLNLAAAGKGMLLVIEDLHWADASTRELLDYMTRRMRGAHVMILATYRQDEIHRKHPLVPLIQGWRRSRLADVIDLVPLPPDGVAEMIAAIFDYGAVSPEFRNFLHERTEGIPFVIEEMLKEAIDRGDIYRTAERWERKELDGLAIPRSVSDSILLRVERLDPEHAEVLRMAGVLGPTFSYTTLIAVTGLDATVVQSALHACVLQQLIVEEGSGRYRFRHALTRESVYEDIITPRRLELHSRAADVLAADATTPAVDLARHLLAAQRWSEAVPVCLLAARDALARYATREAQDLAERALAHIDDELERGRTLALIGDAALAGADLATATGTLERAIDILERHGDVVEAARSHLALGRARWVQTRHEDAAMHYEAARRMLEDLGPSHELALTYVRLSGLAQFDFEEDLAVEHARRAIEIAEAIGDDHTRIWAYVFLGGGLSTSQPIEAIAWLERAVDEAIAAGFVDVASNAVHNTSVTLSILGYTDRCAALLDRYDELPPHPFSTFSQMFVAAANLSVRGYVAESEPLLREARRFVIEGGWPVWQGWAEQWLTIALIYLDRLEDAKDLMRPVGGPMERQEMVQVLQSSITFGVATGDHEIVARTVDDALADPMLLRDGVTAIFAADGMRRIGRGKEIGAVVEATKTPEPVPQHAAVDASRGMLAASEGRTAEALELFRRAIARYDEYDLRLFSWLVRRTRAEVLAKDGRAEEAAEDLQIMAAEASERGATLVVRQSIEDAAAYGVEITVPEGRTVERAETTAPAATTESMVTVMFADVRGYTSMTRETAPAEMHERMTSFYRWARNEIEKRDGMVDRYAGDAVMASWNTAVPSLEHTMQAVETALALQDKAALMDLPVGVGIAVGSALVGRMTGGENMDVIGDTTNLAARLQTQAASGEVALSEEAFRRARAAIDRRGLTVEERALALKGYDEPVPAFVIVRR